MMKTSTVVQNPEVEVPTTEESTFAPIQNPDFLKGLFNPFGFGYEKGMEWVKTASLAAIDDAATRATTNQQIKEKVKIYNDAIEEGLDPKDVHIDVLVFLPFENDYDKFVSKELSDFFEGMMENFFYYQGWDEEIDREVLVEYTTPLTEIPVVEFRIFEDGFTAAVRTHYKSWLLSNSSNL